MNGNNDYSKKLDELKNNMNNELKAVAEKYKLLLSEYYAEKEKIDKLSNDHTNEWEVKFADITKEFEKYDKKLKEMQKNGDLTTAEIEEYELVEFEKIKDKHKDAAAGYKKTGIDLSRIVNKFESEWKFKLLDYEKEVKNIKSKFRKEKKSIAED